MHKVRRTILIFAWILLFFAPLSAQNSPIGLWEHYGLVLRKDNLLKSNTQIVDVPKVDEATMEITEDIVMNYEIFAGLYYKPLSHFIDSEEFFYEKSPETANAISPPQILPENTTIDHGVFDKIYNQPPADEKRKLREEWKKAFGGIDIWYPYFKTREIEEWVKERLSLKMGKLKGKPEFENGQILYVFKSKF